MFSNTLNTLDLSQGSYFGATCFYVRRTNACRIVGPRASHVLTVWVVSPLVQTLYTCLFFFY